MLTFSDFSFANFPDIGDIGFPPLKGTIGTNGSMKVSHVNNVSIGTSGRFFDDLNLRNLLAPGTEITFNQNGLNIGAAFDLDVTQNVGGTNYTRDFGDASFTGRIEPNGTFDMSGSGSLTFGGFSTDNFNMRFRSSNNPGYSIIPAAGVTPNLNFGNLDVPVADFGLHQDGIGYTLRAGDDTNWVTRYWIQQNPPNQSQQVPVLQDRFEWKIALGYDFSSNTLSTSMQEDAKWSWRYLSDNPGTQQLEGGPPPPFPAPPGGWITSGSAFVSGSIGSNGDFTYDPSGRVPPWDPGWSFDVFRFDLWP